MHFVSYIEPELRTITPELERGVADKFGLHKSTSICRTSSGSTKNHVVAVRAIERIKKRGLLADYDFVFTGNLEDYRNPEYINELKAIMGRLNRWREASGFWALWSARSSFVL